MIVAPPDETVRVVTVGDVAKTRRPLPVSSVIAAARFALDGVASTVAMPAPSPETPVPIGRPVAFVSVTDDGVPRAGVIRVGEFAKTIAPLPVSSEIAPAMPADNVVAVKSDVALPIRIPDSDVTPVPPLATDNVPVVIFDISRLGISAATSERNEGAATAPVVGPANTVFAVCVANAAVSVPEDVIGEPLTVKISGMASATLVTEPAPVPAPIAVRNVAASSVETELSAFTRRKVMADGFVSVNRFEPTVVAPRFVRAVAADEAPVPPLVSGT